MKGKWDLKDLDVIHSIQVLVWFAFKAYGSMQKEDGTNLVKASYFRDQMRAMIRGLTGRGILYDARAVYDETIWPPTEVKPLQICELHFSPDPQAGGFIIKVDFFKGVKGGVAMAHPQMKWMPLDILNVEYEVE